VAQRYYRRVIKIRGDDSPNVRFAMAQIAVGLQPTGEVILPGVLPWSDYVKRRQTWDPIMQCIGIDAEFYKGAGVLFFPPEWLNRAERLHDGLRSRPRKAKSIGIDPAEGGDKTAMAAVDELGLIELTSKKTPDTSVIPKEAVAFARKHGLEGSPENWIFDRGGGGKQAADTLRSQGYEGVRTVAFGESLLLDPIRGMRRVEEKVEHSEERYVYVNRRAEMYGNLRWLIDPATDRNLGSGFALPSAVYGLIYQELRHQLAPIPLMYDPEGRIILPPKNRRPGEDAKKSNKVTLVELIGHSPDEADAVVLAIHGLLKPEHRRVAGPMR
jgi:hypothetical protein